jgi:hypothetical protein
MNESVSIMEKKYIYMYVHPCIELRYSVGPHPGSQKVRTPPPTMFGPAPPMSRSEIDVSEMTFFHSLQHLRKVVDSESRGEEGKKLKSKPLFLIIDRHVCTMYLRSDYCAHYTSFLHIVRVLNGSAAVHRLCFPSSDNISNFKNLTNYCSFCFSASMNEILSRRTMPALISVDLCYIVHI